MELVKTTNIFEGMGLYSSGILHLSPKEAFQLYQQGAIMVDVREEYMNRFKMFNVKETIFCPKSILEEAYVELPKDQTLIFADAVGLRSKEAVLYLKERGFDHLANMAGGIVEWERLGLPIKTDTSQRLSGSCMCMLCNCEKK